MIKEGAWTAGSLFSCLHRDMREMDDLSTIRSEALGAVEQAADLGARHAQVEFGGRVAAGLQALVEVMRMRGYGQPLIEKLCFRNWLRVLERTWRRD